ncbi:MAG: hypothetical protein RMJ33_01765 [Saprospiraceae bacterium]|nr:hypothetical protein [Saprospiraceae bacterium]MDW8228539.1 hypothetical protein [Saprospiraceae bacterium]
MKKDNSDSLLFAQAAFINQKTAHQQSVEVKLEREKRRKVLLPFVQRNAAEMPLFRIEGSECQRIKGVFLTVNPRFQ